MLPAVHIERGQAGCDLAVAMGAAAVVVDALRASATIAALLGAGAARVHVVGEVEQARALAASLPGALLAGERGGLPPAGFALGNSPREAAACPDLVGRQVVFTSSNGAQRLVACAEAGQVLVGGPANASAVIAHLHGLTLPIVFIPAGRWPDENYRSCEDDASCALLARALGRPVARGRDVLEAWPADRLADAFSSSAHARYLVALGLAADVNYCALPDTAPVVPQMIGPLECAGRAIGVTLAAVGG